jgi:citronellol/citronellal dehydrogenase
MSDLSIYRSGLFKDNVVLVTGGGTGIGRDIALQFARLGARVAICGRREAPLLETIVELNRLGGENFHTTCDIRSADSCKDAVIAVLQRFGRLDVLVNNAGGQYPSAAEHITPKGFGAVVNNNLMVL